MQIQNQQSFLFQNTSYQLLNPQYLPPPIITIIQQTLPNTLPTTTPINQIVKNSLQSSQQTLTSHKTIKQLRFNHQQQKKQPFSPPKKHKKPNKKWERRRLWRTWRLPAIGKPMRAGDRGKLSTSRWSSWGPPLPGGGSERGSGSQCRFLLSGVGYVQGRTGPSVARILSLVWVFSFFYVIYYAYVYE